MSDISSRPTTALHDHHDDDIADVSSGRWRVEVVANKLRVW